MYDLSNYTIKPEPIILGIESSCDETACAIIKGRKVLADKIISSAPQQALYGGVVPEIASRAHTDAIDEVVQQAIAEAGITAQDIDAVAVTYGAGLLGALLVGLSFAKAFAYSLNVPLLAVDHIRGHMAAAYLEDEQLKPPFLTLLASGGHTAILHTKSYTEAEVLCTTCDDAAGEAFDKVARVLSLPYPGGPNIQKLAEGGVNNILFPSALVKNGDGKTFSYSGLKTAVINYVHSAAQRGQQIKRENVAASFQCAAIDPLVKKVIECAHETGVQTVTAGGGVVANSYLRKALTSACLGAGIRLVLPEPAHCTDNAAMIAAEGLNMYLAGNFSPLSVNAKASIPLKVTIKAEEKVAPEAAEDKKEQAQGGTMYKKVDTSLNFIEREKEIIEFWKQNNIFEKSVKRNEGEEEFSFYDGPPTANGKPHIGHILTRVMKDIIPRYQTMKGKHVLRKAGWDTHGLPVELEVEKLLGIDGKPQIESYGIEPFIKQCKQSVWKYKGEWERMSDRVGYWVDMDNPYVTYDDKYIESEWWALKTMHEKGLLYKGHKIVPYCPRCGTALSSHEVAQGYKLVKENSAVARFKVKGEENLYILAWTTTPWTLPSNVALCMNPDQSYVQIECEGERYIMAEALVDKFFENYTVIEKKQGIEYEGLEYEPLFHETHAEVLRLSPTSAPYKAHFVVCDGYVTMSDGTGVVHIAPAFGEDDYKVGKRYNLPVVQLVNERGCFDERFESLNGVFAKKADKIIIDRLEQEGKLFKVIPFEHEYPHCWRCDTPLLYYARSSWFVAVTKVKEQIIESNRSVNWLPETIKDGRMGNFLENIIDWGLSRDRYWGTPLPVWVCPDCGEIEVIGSKAELKSKCGIPEDEEIELHRPYLDNLVCTCPKCGGAMKRTAEVIDCWFDSGSMPFAQYHYPFENKNLFEETFPADFISEAVDQTRGWFYTLLVINTILFGKSPFKNCIVLGHVNDKNGIKMSKHKGNVVDPWTILDKQGADAVRWYFYTSSAPWLPSRFYEDAVSEVQRKYIGTLWNTYAFFTLYAEIDKFDPSEYSLKDCRLTLMDKWILSKLNTLVKQVDGQLSRYEICESSRALQDFGDLLSNWYVRRCRERYWGKDMTEDKTAAYCTLYECLVTLSKLSAPYTPFISEMIYQNLVPQFYKNAPESVHLCSFPKPDTRIVDAELEKGMDLVTDIVVIGRAARNAGNLKNRQPLSEMVVVTSRAISLSDEERSIILDELNVKKLSFADDASKYISYKLKPQLKTLGPKYGRKLSAISAFLANCNAEEVVAAVRGGGKYEVAELDVVLLEEDLQIFTESTGGYVSAADKGITVALNSFLSEELLDEGVERELISKIQNMRKEAGFEVTDRIEVYFTAEGRAQKVLQSGSFAGAVLANKIEEGEAEGFTKEQSINGEKATITVVRV